MGTINLIWFLEMKAWEALEYDLTQLIKRSLEDTDLY